MIVGKHSRTQVLRAEIRSAGGDLSGRHIRKSWSLPLFAIFSSLAFVSVILASPYPPKSAQAYFAPAAFVEEAQSLEVNGTYTNAVARDAYSVTLPEPEPVAPSVPAAGVPDPGTAQAIAFEMVAARGWGTGEFDCLVLLWNKESGWNVYANNTSSGAYGIPQALPGDKMASAGADWATNPATQITWGLGYIEGRYGTPCGAWATSEDQGWY